MFVGLTLQAQRAVLHRTRHSPNCSAASAAQTGLAIPAIRHPPQSGSELSSAGSQPPTRAGRRSNLLVRHPEHCRRARCRHHAFILAPITPNFSHVLSLSARRPASGVTYHRGVSPGVTSTADVVRACAMQAGEGGGMRAGPPPTKVGVCEVARSDGRNDSAFRFTSAPVRPAVSSAVPFHNRRQPPSHSEHCPVM